MWAKEREGGRGDNTIRKRRNLVEGGVTLQSKRRVEGRVVKLAYDQEGAGGGGRRVGVTQQIRKKRERRGVGEAQPENVSKCYFTLQHSGNE